MTQLEKDPSIIDALRALQARFGGGLRIADHWDGDLMAVGVIASESPDRLVYLSTYRRAPGHYFVELESPAPLDATLPIVEGEKFDDVDFDTLAAIVSRHLGLPER